MTMHDAVVIGAGHHGLVAANMLADAGWSVVVLEATGRAGGAVATGEVTAPGFRDDLFSSFHPLAMASPVLAALDLPAYGLRWSHAPEVLAHPLPDGRCAVLSRNRDTTAASVDAFAPGDGDAWLRMFERWERIGPDVLRLILGPFPPVRATGRLAARLGPAGFTRFARFGLLPVRRFADEEFAGEGAKLLLTGTSLHSDLSPDAAGGALFGWLLAMLGQQLGFPVPRGGAGTLADALVDRLRARGGELVLSAPVARVVVRDGRAVAVRTADGREVGARRAVLADVPAPALYLGLVGAEHLPPRFRADLDRFHWDPGTVKVDWALSGPIPWAARAAAGAGTVHLGIDMATAADHAAAIAGGRLPERPFVLLGQMTTADPTRSPRGTEAAWAYTHVPRGPLAEAELRARVERVEHLVEEYAPGFTDLIIARHVAGPADLEDADPALLGGSINGGTGALHQELALRPTPGTLGPRTPVRGLYLAGSSAHPGGGVHGACGAAAARVALAYASPAGRVREEVLRGAQRVLW